MVCEQWAIDPGILLPDDDYLAWQLRAGLAHRLWLERDKDDPDDAKAPFRAADADIGNFRRMLGQPE